MWIETSAEVYAVIMAKHKKDFKVHSSFSDPDGNGYSYSSGKPEMITEWGFKKAEIPLLKIECRKENKEQTDWSYEYFIECYTIV